MGKSKAVLILSVLLLFAAALSIGKKGRPTAYSQALPEPPPRTPAAVPAQENAHCLNLYRAICQNSGLTRDPTGTVRPDFDGEMAAQEIYERIVEENPDWSSVEVDNEFIRQVYTPKLRGRVESAFRWVTHSLEAFVNGQPATVFTAQEKRQIIQRIRGTQLDLPPYGDEPDLLTKNDVFYERLLDGRMRLRIGGAYLLSAKSWFNLLFTIAHELAHAVDPCELRAAGIFVPSYDRLGACFLKSGLVAARATRAECGQNDQLSETFADWLAVQVAADSLATFATEFKDQQLLGAAINSVRDLCEQEEGARADDFSLHPPAHIRIDRIFGRNPRIRSVLGCAPVQSGPEYCRLK